jgi:iron complex outermembrane receptor protein
MSLGPISQLSRLSIALFTVLAGGVQAQQTEVAKKTSGLVSESSTSNTTAAYETRRTRELERVEVTAINPVRGGGSMLEQTAAKAISTVTREAIQEEGGGSNFTQLIDSMPGVDASSDDPSGLANGNYSLRGFDSSSIGITVNGAPITDTGSYSVYGTQYGDAENYNDITVLQGTPNVDMPTMGAAGGHIAWSTIDPSADFGVDFTQSFGGNDYRRSFMRVNTGDLGPLRSWLSVSRNTKDKWKGKGEMDVTKIDGKSLWQINDSNSISMSFQYSRQSNYRFLNGSKAQIQEDYEYDSDEQWYGSTAGNSSSSTGTYYYKLRGRNPYSNIMISLDGQFLLNDDLRLSVVPYYYYGDGGASTGYGMREQRSYDNNRFGYAVEDLNGDGLIPTSTTRYFPSYAFSHNKTARPGVVAKFIQNIGLDHTLSYGLWLERSRKGSYKDYSRVDQATGEPCDVWAETESCLIRYEDGTPQQEFRTYTITTVQKYFVQDNWTPTDQWQFNLGLAYLRANRRGHSYQWPGANYSSNRNGRYLEIETQFDKDYNQLLPSFGAKYSPDERNQFFYGLAKTFRVPETNAIIFNDIAEVYQSKPETAITHDLGWRYYGSNFGMAAMVYQSNYQNRQIYGYDEDLGLDTYIWIPKVRMRGINWEGSYAFSKNWKGYLSFTRTEAEVRTRGLVDTGDNGAFPLYGKQLADTPKYGASARLRWGNGKVWASIKAKYSGSRYADYMNTEKVGGYTLASLNAGINLPDFGLLKKPALKVNVYNLFDRQAYSYASKTWVSRAGKEQAVAEGVDGAEDWYYSTAYYGVLAPRTLSVTFSGSF